jgi:predicted RND superfamily exporter protein
MAWNFSMSLVQRRLVISVLWIVGRPKLTLALATLVLVASAVFARQRLSVSTDQNDLFSPKVKFFHDYLDFDRLFPENQATYVVVQPRDPRRPPPVLDWVTLADRIAARLRSMPKYVDPTKVEEKIPLLTPQAPGILFEEHDKLQSDVDQIREFLPLVGLWGEQPSALTGLLGRTPLQRFLGAMSLRQPDQETVQFIRVLADSWRAVARGPAHVQVPDLLTIGADDPSQLGYFYVPDEDRTDPPQNLILIRVYENENQTALTSSAETIEAIRDAVGEVANDFRQFKVGLTGRNVLDADENRTTDQDGRRSEIVALIVVFLGLVFLLRSVWLAMVAEMSLAVAIGWTFGWATLSVGRLNLLSTVFLIALIGIGMDYLLQILAAYRRESRRYIRPSAIWARVFRYVGPPVNTACLGAAGAFLVSALTDFKGAAELGIIAGGGLLLCLVSGYTVLPALLVLFPANIKPYPSSERYGPAPRRTRRRLLLPCLWGLLLLAGIPFMRRNEFNPNLLELQAPNLESVKLIRKIQSWQAVVLSPDQEILRQVRNAVRPLPTVAGTESILTAIENNQWLRSHASDLTKIQWAEPAPIEPGDLPAIAARARGLADHLESSRPSATAPALPEAADAPASLRAFADQITAAKADTGKIASALSQWQARFVDQLKRILSMLNPPPLEFQNIPASLRTHLVSTVDPTPIYALYIEPKEDLWGRENLERFEQQVEAAVASVRGAPSVTGITADIYHTTGAIQKAFIQATTYALCLIVILVFIDLRHVGHTMIAVSVLALGLPMLLAFMGVLHLSWNFANFFGLPILIGAGHEYGVFMMHRYKEAVHNPRRVWRRWDPSDRALLLCAFVTSSSFGFFFAFAHHKGLRSLGLVMAVGTLCIYLATIMVVRPLLTWRLEHRRLKQEEGAARPQEMSQNVPKCPTFERK